GGRSWRPSWTRLRKSDRALTLGLDRRVTRTRDSGGPACAHEKLLHKPFHERGPSRHAHVCAVARDCGELSGVTEESGDLLITSGRLLDRAPVHPACKM